MSVYYPSSACVVSQPNYNCNPCPEFEYGRVRSSFFYKSDFSFSDPTDPTEWTTGINALDIIVIWQTQGTYDGGTTSEQPGFGDIPFINGNTTHTVVFKDPNYGENCDFYNALKSSQEWYFGFRTSSKIMLTDSGVIITPKAPVSDDINSLVVWEVTVKWTNPALPCSYDVPAGIFDTCYIAP